MILKKKAFLAGIVLCCMPLMSACSFKDTLGILWNGEETEEASDKNVQVSLEAANIDENVEKPVISSEMGDPVTYGLNGQADAIVVDVAVGDGGTLSYQWYKNNVDSNGGGTPVEGAVENSFVPPTTNAGTTYYYVVITNTVGDGIQMVTSGTKCVTVTEEAAADEATQEEGTDAGTDQVQSTEGTWVEVDGGWKFAYPDGTYAVSKWEYIKGEWYMFDENGFIRTGWYLDGDKYYYFDENGVMLHDTDVEGYHLGSDGVMQ